MAAPCAGARQLAADAPASSSPPSALPQAWPRPALAALSLSLSAALETASSHLSAGLSSRSSLRAPLLPPSFSPPPPQGRDPGRSSTAGRGGSDPGRSSAAGTGDPDAGRGARGAGVGIRGAGVGNPALEALEEGESADADSRALWARAAGSGAWGTGSALGLSALAASLSSLRESALLLPPASEPADGETEQLVGYTHRDQSHRLSGGGCLDPMWILVVTLCVLALLLSIVPAVLFALCLFVRDLLIRAVHPLPRPDPLAEQLLPEPATFVPLILPDIPGVPAQENREAESSATHGQEQGKDAAAPGGSEVATAETGQGTGAGAEVAVDIESQDTPKISSAATHAGSSSAPGIVAAESKAKPGEGATRWPLACAAENTHLASIPRRLVLSGINSISLFYCTLFNRTRVINQERLLQLVLHRPKGTPLITVSNHMSM